MRTILFSSERVTANTWETLGFISCLLMFALAASGYVLQQGTSISYGTGNSAIRPEGWPAQRLQAHS